MSGFQSPNYTQVPNDYFDLVMEMTEAENKVLAALLRATFGYHRDEIKLSIRELARITGLDPKSVMTGGRKLEERGLIDRTVGKITTVSSWIVVIEDEKLYQKIVKTVPDEQYKNDTPLLKKEKKVKESKEAPAARPPDLIDAYLKYQKPAETLIHAVETAFPFNVNWKTKHARQWLEWAHGENITPEQIHKAAETWRSDKKFNWAQPTLQKVFENWPALMGRQNNGVIGIPKSNMRELDDTTPMPYIEVQIGD